MRKKKESLRGRAGLYTQAGLGCARSGASVVPGGGSLDGVRQVEVNVGCVATGPSVSAISA